MTVNFPIPKDTWMISPTKARERIETLIFNDFCPLSELLADILENRPVEESSFESVVVVDNAPQVGPDRIEKLKGVLKKVFGRFGTIQTEFFPMDEKNVFKG